jgi:hypothetical protein
MELRGVIPHLGNQKGYFEDVGRKKVRRIAEN